MRSGEIHNPSTRQAYMANFDVRIILVHQGAS